MGKYKNSKRILDPTSKFKSIQVFKYSSLCISLQFNKMVLPTNNVKARDLIRKLHTLSAALELRGR